MVNIKSYLEKLQNILRDWDTKIDGLKVKADSAQEKVKVEYQKQVENIRTKQQQLRDKVQGSLKVGGEATEQLKAGLEKSANEIRNAINNALSKFK